MDYKSGIPDHLLAVDDAGSPLRSDRHRESGIPYRVSQIAHQIPNSKFYWVEFPPLIYYIPFVLPLKVFYRSRAFTAIKYRRQVKKRILI